MKVRSIFLSDIHLGTRGCQADSLIAFLRADETDHLFPLGDIHRTAAQRPGARPTPP